MLNLKPDLVLTNTTIGNAAKYRRLEAAGVTGPTLVLIGRVVALHGEAVQQEAA